MSDTIVEYMDISDHVQIQDLAPVISCRDARQTVYEMLTESIDDIDLNEFYDIICTVDGGKEWFETAIPKIIRAYYGYKIGLVNVDIGYRNFIKTVTSKADIMCRVINGKVWSETQVDQFIKWCSDENGQSPQKRNNYYYIINEYFDGDVVPIGIVGVIKKKKHNPKGVNFNLVIFIDTKYQDYGAGTAAIAACLEKYWSIYPSRPITFNIPEDRPDMVKVAIKLGATFDKEFSTNLCGYKKYIATPHTFKFNPELHLEPSKRRRLIKSRKRLIKMAKL